MRKHAGAALLSVLLLALAREARALEIPMTVVNRDDKPRKAEPVSMGVPFAKGVLTDTRGVRLDSANGEVPVQTLVTARWPDGSVRWLLVDTLLDLPASAGLLVSLRTDAEPFPVTGIAVQETQTFIQVDTRATTFSLFKGELTLGGKYFELTRGGEMFRAIPDPSTWRVEERGPVKVVLRVEGRFWAGETTLTDAPVGFRARLTFFRDRTDVRVQLTLRNNGGFNWDGGMTRGPTFDFSAITFGTPLEPGAGHYVFGPSVEKTWELLVPKTGTPALLDSRYRADGTLAIGYTPPAPLAQLQPAYVAATGAWGRVSTPVTGLSDARQADFDRWEKIQRAQVIRTEVENPPGLTGTTLFGHLAQDLASWNDYGDLRWDGNGCGTFSGNHYDWSYGMYLQFLRTGQLPFADAARVFARHEVDLDVYHTNADGAAFNYQKDWEDRPSHESPDNCFGGGRPTHTWSQGYALHWILTGDHRGKDAFDEIQEGVRQYVYESFNDQGVIRTNEIRTQGWLTENLVNLWRVDPEAQLATSCCGTKSVPAAIKDVLTGVFALESAAGGKGFVFDGDPSDPNLRAPLQHLYFLEPAIKAYEEVLRDRDPATAAQLLSLIRRMTDWLMSLTVGGDTNAQGLYRPLQIPTHVDVRQTVQDEHSTAYLLKASNAAAFVYLATGETKYRDYARAGFQDFVRYAFVTGGDVKDSTGNLAPVYIDPTLRSPASYNSNLYAGTESKVHGWTSRYGQLVLGMEAGGGTSGGGTAPQAVFTFSPQQPAPGATVTFTDASTGAPTSWSWSFGDGGTSSLQSPTHAYAAAGTYTVTLAVANASGTNSASQSLVVEAPPSGASAALFVPVILAAPGLGGSAYSSELTLTNRGSTPADVSLDYVATAGGGSGTVSLTLGAGEQRVLPDTIATLREQGLGIADSGTRLGTLRVRFSGLSAPTAGFATVRTTTAVPEGRAGLAYGAVPQAQLLSGPAWIGGLKQDAADRSNLALMNAGTAADGSVTLRVTVYTGEPGAPSGLALPDVTLSPGGFQQIGEVLASNGLALTRGYARVERVSGTAPFYAYGVVNDRANSDGSFLPPVASSQTSARGAMLPVVLETAAFASEVTLTNVSAEKRTLTLALAADSLTTPDKTARLDVVLEAGEQRVFPAFVQNLRDARVDGVPPAGTDVVGPLFLSSPAGDASSVLLSARTSTPGGGGRYGLAYPAVPAGAAATGAAWLYGLRQDTQNRTNLALVSTGEADAGSIRLRIEIFDGATGALAATVEGDGTTVSARGFTQLGRVLATYAPAVNQGYARVSRVSGQNPFVTYAVINDGAAAGQRSGDGAYVAMQVESQQARVEDSRLSPETHSGPGEGVYR